MPLCGGKKTVQRKLVLLGDGACGKTSLLNVFTRGFFPVGNFSLPPHTSKAMVELTRNLCMHV
jgi:secreted trypsin-like serine protease